MQLINNDELFLCPYTRAHLEKKCLKSPFLKQISHCWRTFCSCSN